MQTLRDTVFVARLPHAKLKIFMRELTQILLYREDEERRLFSFTVQNEEVTLLLDETAVPLFVPLRSVEGFDISPIHWRAIQVREYGGDLSGLLSVMATKLAQVNVSLINLSLFTTDLILIRSDDLSMAFETLKSAIVEFEQKRLAFHSCWISVRPLHFIFEFLVFRPIFSHVLLDRF